AGTQDRVEGLGDAPRGQVELGEVLDHPGGAGEVLLGRGDEDRVDVDADDGVPPLGEVAPVAAGAAAGVEDPRPAGHHRVDEPRLTDEVGAGLRHLPEALDVPVRVL